MNTQNKTTRKSKTWLFLIPVVIILLFIFILILNQFISGSTASSYLTDTEISVQKGDSVHIDYTGTIDGEIFENSSTQGSGAVLKIGSGSYVDGFEEQLIGTHPGDTVNVSVTFPEDYSSLALRGQDAVFEVTLHGIFR